MQLIKNQINYGLSFDKRARCFALKLYAPDISEIKLNINDEFFIPLKKENDHFFLRTNKLKFNDRYSFIIDGLFEIPDPFSNFQDKKNNIKSVVIKHDETSWDDKDFTPVSWDSTVIYQLHIGCFTKRGTFSEATLKLDYLKDLGINCIQLMPIAKFFGSFNWGYDSALHFAVDEKYATPNEFKNFINEAHKRGISVFLDVVYSHFAIEGNYLHLLANSKIYNEKIKTPWGSSINYKNEFIQDYITQNVEFWIKNYHIDGFRFDASHVIERDFLYKVKNFVGSKYPKVRLILENENNEAHYLKCGFDAQWNDDFHHVLKAGAFKDSYKYLSDYKNLSFASMMTKCITQGYFYQGEYSQFKKGTKGENSRGLPLSKFINFIQNHDQVGNRIEAKRLNSYISKNDFKACALLYLLLPQIPMIFMGEEINSKNPFHYFYNFSNELNEIIENARKDEFKTSGLSRNYTSSFKDSTFLSSKIDWTSIDYDILYFYKNTLKIRQELLDEVYLKDYKVSSEILANEVFKIKFGEMLTLIANFSDKCINISFSNVFASSRDLCEIDEAKVPAMTTLWCKNDKEE